MNTDDYPRLSFFNLSEFIRVIDFEGLFEFSVTFLPHTNEYCVNSSYPKKNPRFMTKRRLLMTL